MRPECRLGANATLEAVDFAEVSCILCLGSSLAQSVVLFCSLDLTGSIPISNNRAKQSGMRGRQEHGKPWSVSAASSQTGQGRKMPPKRTTEVHNEGAQSGPFTVFVLQFRRWACWIAGHTTSQHLPRTANTSKCSHPAQLLEKPASHNNVWSHLRPRPYYRAASRAGRVEVACGGGTGL